MREIKFRTWCKEGPSMLDWDYLINEPDFADFMKGAHVEDAYYSRLMQYTGLKDKNGKEIYEGDIIKSEDGIVSRIVYDEASFKSVWIHNDHLVNCILDNLFIKTLNPIVVGNIYENPELIKN
ncbi:YopX family protein [Bacillus thuringiensis]|uniref:YopX family protein n=1 Tax=Bacillus TaxID=1386 RepID=UPI0011A5FBA2|nr:YopX family protein [Bacillus thuringiensis]